MRQKIKTRRLRGVPVQHYAGTLTPEQFATLRFRDDLMHYGPGEKQVFADEGERRRAYLEHRERFVGTTNRGTRVPAFWQYEEHVPGELRSLWAWLQAHQLIFQQGAEALAASGRLSEARRRWLEESP